MACPATCSYFPFATTADPLWLKLELAWMRKVATYLGQRLGPRELQRRIEQFTVPMKDSDLAMECGFQHAVYFSLFIERDPAGQTRADQWAAEGWPGLVNDERVMMGYRRHVLPTVLEIRRMISSDTVECLDLLAPESAPFQILDRGLATQCVRFQRVLTWVNAYPHYSRISGVTAEVPFTVWSFWHDWLQQRWRKAAEEHPELTLKHFLAENIVVASTAISGMQRELYRRVRENLDLNHCLASFKLNRPVAEIEAALRNQPELRVTERPPDPEIAPPVAIFEWSEATATATASAPADTANTTDTEDTEAATPGTAEASDTSTSVDGPREGSMPTSSLWLYEERLVLETRSHRRYERAREQLGQWLSDQIEFQEEKIVDLAELAQQRRLREQAVTEVESDLYDDQETQPANEEDATEAPSSSTPSAEQSAGLAASLEAEYREFLDKQQPILEGKTPREAAQEPALRSQLIELVKWHLVGLQRRNRDHGTQLTLDWVLDELGLGELK